MKIRLACDEDYVGIAELRRSTIRAVNSNDYPEEIIHSWSSKVEAEDFSESADKYKRWVAIDENKIIGFCEHTFACEISRLYVHKNHLRKGVGSQLMKVAEDSLRNQGCQEISLESTLTAKDFYEKNGYKIIEKTSYKENKNAPIYKMSKKIS